MSRSLCTERPSREQPELDTTPVAVPLTFSRPLERIEIDGKQIDLSSEKLGIVLPKGKHLLEIKTRTSSFQVIDHVGYVSSSLFYFFGLFSVLLLIGVYVYFRLTFSKP